MSDSEMVILIVKLCPPGLRLTLAGVLKEGGDLHQLPGINAEFAKAGISWQSLIQRKDVSKLLERAVKEAEGNFALADRVQRDLNFAKQIASDLNFDNEEEIAYLKDFAKRMGVSGWIR